MSAEAVVQDVPEEIQKEAQKKGIVSTTVNKIWSFFKDCGMAFVNGIREAFFMAPTMLGAGFGQMLGILLAIMVVVGAGALMA
jgi:hypothetical protein